MNAAKRCEITENEDQDQHIGPEKHSAHPREVGLDQKAGERGGQNCNGRQRHQPLAEAIA
jgi:hypothetical protein